MRAAQCLHFKKLTFDRFAYFLRLFHIYFTMTYDLTLFKGHWFSQVLVFILIICKETTFLSAQMEKLTEKSILYHSVKWKRGILISALVGLGMWRPRLCYARVAFFGTWFIVSYLSTDCRTKGQYVTYVRVIFSKPDIWCHVLFEVLQAGFFFMVSLTNISFQGISLSFKNALPYSLFFFFFFF